MCACYVSVMCLRGVLEVGGLGVVPSGESKSCFLFRRHRPYLFRSLSRVTSRLNMLGEPWRGSKFCDLTLPPLFCDPSVCVFCFSLGDETYF